MSLSLKIDRSIVKQFLDRIIEKANNTTISCLEISNANNAEKNWDHWHRSTVDPVYSERVGAAKSVH
jgi:hypothetical protein